MILIFWLPDLKPLQTLRNLQKCWSLTAATKGNTNFEHAKADIKEKKYN